jgi:hypothetical protein
LNPDPKHIVLIAGIATPRPPSSFETPAFGGLLRIRLVA